MQQTATAITSLIPFNPSRFDACMGYVAGRFGRPLSRPEMGRLHVMTDVYHVLGQGHQAIGGDLEPGRWGPVVRPADDRLRRWEQAYEASGAHPPAYVLHAGDPTGFEPRGPVDGDDFAPSEVDAMAAAIVLLRPMTSDDADAFFRGDTFMGRPYQSAVRDGRPLDWGEIIDAYDQLNGTDHQAVRRRLISYG